MPTSTIIVANAEIPLKSSRVRSFLTNRLISQIIFLLKKSGEPNIKVKRGEGRVIIFNVKDLEKSIRILSHTFGISALSPVEITKNDRDEIISKAIEIFNSEYQDQSSFAIKARRFMDLPFTSYDLANEIGRRVQLMNRDLNVNLSKPDLTIYIEARSDGAYIYCKKIHGPAGLPYGSQGTAISLILDGYDVIAMWLLMRRGLKIIPVHIRFAPIQFESDPILAEIKKIREIIPVDRFWIYRVDPPKELKRRVSRRVLYRFALMIASKEDAKGIGSGERYDPSCPASTWLREVMYPILRPLFLLQGKEIHAYRELATITIDLKDVWKEHVSKNSMRNELDETTSRELFNHKIKVEID
ncbi:THUMP domain-containing protein [[Eubacterium] cellulosolvens]